MTDQPILSMQDVTLAFGPKIIQKNITLNVRKGSIFAVMGGSGCGKSTLLKSMIGLLRPTTGAYQVQADNYWRGTEAERAEVIHRFGVLFPTRA